MRKNFVSLRDTLQMNVGSVCMKGNSYARKRGDRSGCRKKKKLHKELEMKSLRERGRSKNVLNRNKEKRKRESMKKGKQS